MAVRAKCRAFLWFAAALAFYAAASGAHAAGAALPGPAVPQPMPPHPGLLTRMRAEGYTSAMVVSLQRLSRLSRAKGVDQPRPISAPVTGSRPALVLLVDYSDRSHDSVSTSSLYGNMLFSTDTYPAPGSMRDFYRAASYGSYDISPAGVDADWRQVSHPHNYYANADGVAGDSDDYGWGSYPQNAQGLVVDAVTAANPYVDFASFAVGGVVQGLFVIHQGPAGEVTGDPSDIWSHQWSLGAHALTVDGVTVDYYSMEPEYVFAPGDSTIGIFCHEYGHVIGLPDLYDTDYTSAGLGFWSVMAFGSWNGHGTSYDGSSPAYFDAYCRLQLGWITPQVPTTNLPGASLPQVEDTPTVYKLWTVGAPGPEYFLLENRQRVGFDGDLPGSGLLLYHVDETADQTNDWHPLVMLEQADAYWDLQYYYNQGDSGDPYPGSSGNRSATISTTPDTLSYAGTDTQVSITDISDSAATMTADLDVNRVSQAHFSEVGAAMNLPNGIGGAWGDYDNDGYPDLYIDAMWGSHRATLWHNNGNGTFTEVATLMGLHADSGLWEDWACAWGDFNNDGRLDLIVSGGGHPIFLYRNDGDHFTDVGAAAGLAYDSTTRVHGLAWGDYDGDNWLDLYVSYGLSNSSILYHNNHDGTFTNVTIEAGMEFSPVGLGMGTAWDDYNNDGLPDLLVAQERQPTGTGSPPRLYRNDGDGTFTDMGIAAGLQQTDDAAGVAWGDYDNDGEVDFYLTANHPRPHWLYHNNGNGTFTDNIGPAGMGAWQIESAGAAWADYDNDGYLDLAVANAGNGYRPFLYHNNGGGAFTELAVQEGMDASRHYVTAVWADYNLDGKPDLFASANVQDSYSTLYRNDGAASDGNWLRVRALTSATGDATDGSPVRDALGARVDVNLDNDLAFPPGRTLRRSIDGGSSFCGQNEPIGQFGLGTATTVAVRVVFPDHHIVIRSGVAANQQLEIRDVQQGLGEIQGHVTDARNGNPVVAGTVSCSYLTALTDVAGAYRLSSLPAGSYSVTASGAGFASLTVHDVVVPSGAAVTVDFALGLPATGIQGVVKDAGTNLPISGATVTCSDQTSITGADGAYSFTLAAGSYAIVASAPGYETSTVPNVVVTAGQMTVVDVRLGLAPGTITGQVTDQSTEEAVVGAVVSCEGTSATSDSIGHYLLAVSAGTGLVVTATAEGYHTATITGVTVNAGQATTLDIALAPNLGAIAGTVEDEVTRLPLRGATVTGGGTSATTDYRGAYTLTGVRPGTYAPTAVASGYQTGTVTGVTVAGGETAEADFALTPAATGTISGSVTDAQTGQGLAGARVNCGVLQATTDALGAYTLTGLAAGAYRVGARAGGYAWASTTDVVVAADQTATQDFALSRLPAAAVQFQDLSAAAGIPSCIGAGWTDYDGDGYPDLFVSGADPAGGTGTSTHGPLLYRNDEDLTFTDVSASVGLPATPEEQDGVAWGDYDNDGSLDVLVGSGAGYPRLYRWTGSGFAEVGEEAGVQVTFSAGRGVTWCDYNGDNLLDAFCSNIFGPGYLLRNDGDGTFTDVAAQAGMTGDALSDQGQSASWGDYNNDGLPDLALARMAKATKLYRNNGDGTFTDVSTASGVAAAVDAFSAVWGDYDNDGWLDLYVTTSSYIEGASDRDWLFHNDGDGTFTEVGATAGMAGDEFTGLGAAWGDYDNDGYLDLFVSNIDTDNQPFLYHNNGNGTLTDVAATVGVAGSVPGEAAAWADIDVDGLLDLFQGVAGPTSRLFHNVGPAGHWLRVRALTSATGDATAAGAVTRDAIGAVVQVNVDNDRNFVAGRTLTRLIDGGSGYCGQNEPIAQFGIPTDGPVAVRVRFPDGTVVTHYGVEVNQALLVADTAAALAGDYFTDAGYDSWAFGEIEACVTAGVVHGYDDGTYKPSLTVTRDQMAVYISRALLIPTGDAALPAAPAEPSFSDVPTDHWAYRWVEYAVSRDVVQGYSDGTYHPDEVVNRGQMAVYVARAVAGGDDAVPPDTDGATFIDVTDANDWAWAYRYVEYCSAHGIVQGYADDTYRPDNEVTRDQMAVYVARAFELPL